MRSPRRSGYESLTVGFMFIAVAVSLLVAWVLNDWWLFVPITLIVAGLFWSALGLAMKPGSSLERPGRREMSYFVFWGATLALLGAIWLINDQYPDNVPALVALFLIWIGAVAVILSVGRFKRNGNT